MGPCAIHEAHTCKIPSLDCKAQRVMIDLKWQPEYFNTYGWIINMLEHSNILEDPISMCMMFFIVVVCIHQILVDSFEPGMSDLVHPIREPL